MKSRKPHPTPQGY